ncbi:MAG TPA: FkbM family methyltransferase, partial [bacterium]|nr:FkbM family methyltransferase [bacterium]
YEPAVSRFIRKSLPRGGTAIDVGANVGCHALIMADAVGSDGTVYALEPHPRSFRRLRDNLALNRLDVCRPDALALGDEEKEATLYGPGEGRASRGVASLYPGIVPAPRGYPVTVTTLDVFCRDRNPSRLDLIKIDTEGNELKVIRGGAATLARYRPILILEYSPRTWTAAGATLEEAAAELGKLGYRLDPLPGGKGDLGGRASADLLGTPMEKADR